MAAPSWLALRFTGRSVAATSWRRCVLIDMICDPPADMLGHFPKVRGLRKMMIGARKHDQGGIASEGFLEPPALGDRYVFIGVSVDD